jgi:aromatic ring hydroxylase
MIRTPEEYIESLRDGRVVNQDGELVKDVPTRYRPTAERMASEFWIAVQPQYRSLFNMMEDGEEVSFSFKIPETGEDLKIGGRSPTPQRISGSRLTGIDGLNGVAYATKKPRGNGHKVRRTCTPTGLCKKNDPSICAAVSDRGNRRLHAEDQQAHRTSTFASSTATTGIYITGCKLHISSQSFPTNSWCCRRETTMKARRTTASPACPLQCQEVLFMAQRTASGQAPMIVFDNVFVPWRGSSWPGVAVLPNDGRFVRPLPPPHGRDHHTFTCSSSPAARRWRSTTDPRRGFKTCWRGLRV